MTASCYQLRRLHFFSSLIMSPTRPSVRAILNQSHSRIQRGHLCIKNEISYVMVKPDGVQRGLVGEVLGRFERKGYRIKGLKMMQCSRDLAERHYEELKERPFFPKLVDYIISGPVVCVALEGQEVVKGARSIIGLTNPTEAAAGTIRGDLAIDKGRNVVHGSDSVENGLRETALWFDENELLDWESTMINWIEE